MTLPIGEVNFRVTALFDARDRLERLAAINQIEPEEVWRYATGLPRLLEEEACLVDIVTDDSFRELKRILVDFDGAIQMRREILDETSQRQIDRDIRNYADRIRPLFGLLLHQFRQELPRMPICLASPRRQAHELWQDVRKMFVPDHAAYDRLPELARLDFQEAAWCFVFDQFTACAIMSMRAAEACLHDYIQTVAPGEFDRRDGWAKAFEKIGHLNLKPEIDTRLYDKLHNGNRIRNRYAHPGLRAEASDLNETEDVFNTAKMIAIYVYKDLFVRGMIVAELTE